MLKTTLLVCVFTGLTLSAQWQPEYTEKLCSAVSEEDWSEINKLIKKHIKRWSYLDTSLGYPDYGRAIDSLVGIFQDMSCVSDAFADACAIKLAIWPGTSIIGVKFQNQNGIHEFCYNIREGRTRSVRINGVLHIPLQSREELVYVGYHTCQGFIKEQRQICREQEEK